MAEKLKAIRAELIAIRKELNQEEAIQMEITDNI
jgi:hypothetical protein